MYLWISEVRKHFVAVLKQQFLLMLKQGHVKCIIMFICCYGDAEDAPAPFPLPEQYLNKTKTKQDCSGTISKLLTKIGLSEFKDFQSKKSLRISQANFWDWESRKKTARDTPFYFESPHPQGVIVLARFGWLNKMKMEKLKAIIHFSFINTFPVCYLSSKMQFFPIVDFLFQLPLMHSKPQTITAKRKMVRPSNLSLLFFYGVVLGPTKAARSPGDIDSIGHVIFVSLLSERQWLLAQNGFREGSYS